MKNPVKRNTITNRFKDLSCSCERFVIHLIILLSSKCNQVNILIYNYFRAQFVTWRLVDQILILFQNRLIYDSLLVTKEFELKTNLESILLRIGNYLLININVATLAGLDLTLRQNRKNVQLRTTSTQHKAIITPLFQM